MQRVPIQEARKLFDMGVIIYLLPSHTEYVPGIKISVFTYNLKDKDFDSFVNNYKAVSSNKMRYYVEEREVKAAKQAHERIKKLNSEKSISKSASKKIKGLDYTNEALMKIGSLAYTYEELMKIGRNIAMLWGAECYDYKIDYSAKKVTFLCVEFGEKFATDVNFNELKGYMN